MKKILLLLACLSAVLVACKKETLPPGPQRTVIVYMVADNDLYPYSVQNINDMEGAWDDSFEGHMVVYLHPRVFADETDENLPRLLLISRDPNGGAEPYNPNNAANRIVSRVLKTYTRDQNPTDPAVMSAVIADAMALAPADNYGLVFWSHGSGWIPQGMGGPLKSQVPPSGDPFWGGSKLEGIAEAMAAVGSGAQSSKNTVVGYSFGVSSSHSSSEMEIDAMAAALPVGTVFDFILFDACHMGCVELAWELRDRAKYLISSVAEVLGTGFPYRRVMKPMFAQGEADVVGIAQEFFKHYDAQPGAYRTGLVSVVDNGRLPELAEAVKALCDEGLPVSGFDTGAQQYGRTKTMFHNTFYDLGALVGGTWSGTVSPDKLAAFNEALAEAVPYAAATPWILQGQEGEIQVNRHCGLSCYLPRTVTPRSLEAYRTRFDWSRASGLGSLAE